MDLKILKGPISMDHSYLLNVGKIFGIWQQYSISSFLCKQNPSFSLLQRVSLRA